MTSDIEITSIVTWLLAGAPLSGSLENLVGTFADMTLRFVAAAPVANNQ